RRAFLLGILGELHRPAEIALAADPHGVVAALPGLGLPADEIGVERNRGFRVRRHQLVPDEVPDIPVRHGGLRCWRARRHALGAGEWPPRRRLASACARLDLLPEHPWSSTPTGGTTSISGTEGKATPV